MQIFEDLYAYKTSTDIYLHLWGRSLGNVVIAIYGYETNAATGQDYWIVRMPWGTSFGTDKGYIRVQKGTNNCGIENPGSVYYFNNP